MNSPPDTTTAAVRYEMDSLGRVAIPEQRLWGAQTQRCLGNFAIGGPRYVWPAAVIKALGRVKKCAALANCELQQLPQEKTDLMARVADEVIAGKWDAEFPLLMFQSGSGTQTNMNANEVIANRAIQLVHGQLGSKNPIHPNDDVNRSQSSNDVFPTVMHLACVEQLHATLLPALQGLIASLAERAAAFPNVVLIGRTHLQDAVPVTLGQVISGWQAQLQQALAGLNGCLPGLYELAIGGTAVGTGLNAPAEFGDVVARLLAKETGHPFVSAGNKFAALSAHDALVAASATLRTLAAALMKIANDVRWYSSGPRAGLGELSFPANEPGSSIMPGKVNPTQCEVLTMIAVQVYGNDHAVAFAGSQGNFQLNVFKPVILHNVLESIRLLADGCRSFDEHCVRGIEPVESRIQQHLADSLMLVTALNPYIGYERSAQIAKAAYEKQTTLRAAAIDLGILTGEQFDTWVRPAAMVRPEADQA